MLVIVFMLAPCWRKMLDKLLDEYDIIKTLDDLKTCGNRLPTHILFTICIAKHWFLVLGLS